MKLSEILDDSLQQVRANGISKSAMHLLLADTLKLGLADIFTEGEKEIPIEQQTLWQHNFQRLLKGEPPQYISGQACFWGLDIGVGPGVLIPRPETEGLVDLALHRLTDCEKVLDCCTGSGAIAITLKKFRPHLILHATDASAEALAIARENADLHELEIEFFRCDLFAETEMNYDVIVANPPYVSEDEYQALHPMVRDFEPGLALISGKDGLCHIRKILRLAPTRLKPGGMLFLEHGETQRQAITDYAQNFGWILEYAGNDLAGKARYLIFRT